MALALVILRLTLMALLTLALHLWNNRYQWSQWRMKVRRFLLMRVFDLPLLPKLCMSYTIAVLP